MLKRRAGLPLEYVKLMCLRVAQRPQALLGCKDEVDREQREIRGYPFARGGDALAEPRDPQAPFSPKRGLLR